MEALFNLFKVRFTILDELMRKECHHIKYGDKINVFINLDCVVRRLMRIPTERYSRISKISTQEFTANVLNLAAHYRLYFSKHKLYSKVYIYFTSPMKEYKNTTYNDKYRSNWYSKLCLHPDYKIIGKTIRESSEIIQIISEYIEGVYFVQSGNIEGSVLPYIITHESDDECHNFIVTTDLYDFQYVNQGFNIVFPKKEESLILNDKNMMDFVKMMSNVDNKIKTPNVLTYPFILSVLGDTRRDIPRMSRFGMTTILKTINSCIEKQIITDRSFNINMMLKVVKEEARSILLDNYYTVDLQSQFKVLYSNDIHSIMKQIKDKFDNLSLKELNQTYFSEVPIQLIELCSGAQYKENKKFFKLKER